MAKSSRKKGVFSFIDDPDPTHGPVTGFKLFWGPEGTVFDTTVDPDVYTPSLDLGMLPDLGGGRREFVINDLPALMALPEGVYSAAVAGHDGAGNWTDFAVDASFPLDLTAPTTAPTDLHIENA